MDGQRAHGAAPGAALAIGGFAAGHALCCLAASIASSTGAPDAHQHEGLHSASSVLLPAAALVVAVLSIAATLHGRRAHAPRWRTLASAQVAMLVTYEAALALVADRSVDLGAASGGLALSIAAQLAVAASLAALARVIVRMVHAAGGFVAVRAPMPRPRLRREPDRGSTPIQHLRCAAALGRAPPRTFASV